jgi:hypothetical protein
MKKWYPLLIVGALLLSLAGKSQDRSEPDDEVGYKLLRNEPDKSGLLGVSLEPVSLDMSRLNVNVGGGFTLYYTFNSLLRISGGYRYAYLDNFLNEKHKEEPVGDWDSYGIPYKSERTSCLSFLISPTIFSSIKEKEYTVVLGRTGYRTMAVTHVPGNVMKALTGRLGYMVDNKVIESNNGLSFKTTASPYVYHYQDVYQQDQTLVLTPDNLSTSATIMKSNIAVIGVAYTAFHDLKVKLRDSRFRGTRQETRQTDFFVDFLYAHQIRLQDMIYYHSVYVPSVGGGHMPQRLDLSATPLRKTGFRFGFQVANMYSSNFGTKFALEAGVRPGVKPEGNTGKLYGQITFGFLFGGRIAS